MRKSSSVQSCLECGREYDRNEVKDSIDGMFGEDSYFLYAEDLCLKCAFSKLLEIFGEVPDSEDIEEIELDVW